MAFESGFTPPVPPPPTPLRIRHAHAASDPPPPPPRPLPPPPAKQEPASPPKGPEGLSGEALQEMLGQLRRDGSLDSSGAFTLDLDKSLEKLSQFQLENPRRYVHFLVAAAYTRGASYIQFEVGPRDVLACFDGQPFTHYELVNLFHCLFEAQATASGRAAHHLAFALNVTRQIGAKFVVFDSWGEDKGSRVQLTSGLLQVARLPERPWSDPRITNRFHMQEPIDPDLVGRLAEGVARRLSGSSQMWPEQEMLTNGRCGFCPLQIWVNGQILPPPIDAALECWSPELRPGGLPRSIPISAVPGGRELRGGVGLCREHHGCIFWILDGLAYRDVLDRTLPKEVAFWVYCDELKTDVSRGQLVVGPELTERRRCIHELAETALPRLQARLRENPRAAQKFKGFSNAVLSGGYHNG